MTLEETAQKLLKNAYGDEVQVIDIKSEKGTKPGENYGSLMSALTVTIETKNHNKSTLHLMAKCLPTSGFIRDAFNVYVTFPKEIEFYQIVIPDYMELLKESNIDIDFQKGFPRFIGAHSSTKEDIILIMENIKTEGYRLGPKSQGLDFEHSVLVLKDIALFHALGIATKVKTPEMYKAKIKKVGRPLKEGQDVNTVKAEIDKFLSQVLDYLKGITEIEDLVPRLEKVMKDNFVYADMLVEYKPREPFSTLVHNDLWFNNIMFKYDDRGKPVSVKLVDFQRTKVGSPISDLMLFLYVNTSLDVMKSKFDALLQLYHDNLTKSLKCLGVSTEGLRWKNFEQELMYASEEVSMPVAMLRFLFMKVNCDISEFDMKMMGNIAESEECKTRHVEVVRDLARRSWI